MKHLSIYPLVLVTIALLTLGSMRAEAQNFTLGLGPVGHYYAIDSRPELGWGVGGELWLDYRWSPQVSTQFGVIVTTQNGKGADQGDNNIEFLGIPTFDVKYYLMASDSRWDPYLLIGMGLYSVTQGSISNGTPAIGLGANAGIGMDYYITQKVSLGLSAVFRSIAMIDGTAGSNNGASLFPLTMAGYLGFHF